jgi:hypothetical protein
MICRFYQKPKPFGFIKLIDSLSILLHFLSQSSLVLFQIKNVDSQWVKNLLGLGPTTQLFSGYASINRAQFKNKFKR